MEKQVHHLIRSRTHLVPVAPIAVITLLVLSTLNLFVPQASAVTFQPSKGWWNADFRFQRSITLSNSYNYNFTGQPVFLHLSFEASHLTSGINELRLVNSSGQEVPAYVLDERSTGPFVTSVWMVFLASLRAHSSRTLELYYGNAIASAPSYRSEKPGLTGQVNFLKADDGGNHYPGNLTIS